MKLQELIDLYLVHREIAQISEHTLAKDAWHLQRLIDYLGDTAVVDVDALTISRFMREVRQLNGDPYAESTVNGFVHPLRQLFDFAIELGVLAENPAGHLKSKQMKQKAERIASRQYVDFILSRLESYIVERHHHYSAIRDAFVFSFSADSAARRGEIHMLRVSAMERAIRTPTPSEFGLVYHVSSTGKTGDVNLIFGDRTLDYYQRLIRKRPSSSSDMLILNRSGRHVTLATMSETFRRLSRFCEVPTVQAHNIRHLNITEMIVAGVDAKTVAKYANHASEIVTLMIYRHLMTGEVDNAAARLIYREQAPERSEIERLFGIR